MVEISNEDKIKLEEYKISQYDAEIYQLESKIEEIKAAKSICEKRIENINKK